MHYYSPDDSHLKQRSVRFIRRMFAMRQLGTFLCFFPFLSVLMAVWLTLPLATCNMLALSAVSYQLTLSLRRKNRELERISLMDPSLKIPNRRLFDRQLESEYLRTLRGDGCAWLMLLDVDNFKQVNDRFGNEAGDYLLAEISMLLRSEVSTRDIPARFGGDELGVIVRDADNNSIVILAAALKEKIAQIRLPASPNFQCSVSIGIAPASSADSIHQWLRHADQALYSVKRTGRDGIQLWQPEPQNLSNR